MRAWSTPPGPYYYFNLPQNLPLRLGQGRGEPQDRRDHRRRPAGNPRQLRGVLRPYDGHHRQGHPRRRRRPARQRRGLAGGQPLPLLLLDRRGLPGQPQGLHRRGRPLQPRRDQPGGLRHLGGLALRRETPLLRRAPNARRRLPQAGVGGLARRRGAAPPSDIPAQVRPRPGGGRPPGWPRRRPAYTKARST